MVQVLFSGLEDYENCPHIFQDHRKLLGRDVVDISKIVLPLHRWQNNEYWQMKSGKNIFQPRQSAGVSKRSLVCDESHLVYEIFLQLKLPLSVGGVKGWVHTCRFKNVDLLAFLQDRVAIAHNFRVLFATVDIKPQGAIPFWSNDDALKPPQNHFCSAFFDFGFFRLSLERSSTIRM